MRVVYGVPINNTGRTFFSAHSSCHAIDKNAFETLNSFGSNCDSILQGEKRTAAVSTNGNCESPESGKGIRTSRNIAQNCQAFFVA